MLTPVQALDHFEFACRSAVLINFNFVIGFLIGYCETMGGDDE